MIIEYNYRIGKCELQLTTEEKTMIEFIVCKVLEGIKTLCEKNNAKVVVTKTPNGDFVYKPECKDYDTLMLMYYYMSKEGLN